MNIEYRHILQAFARQLKLESAYLKRDNKHNAVEIAHLKAQSRLNSKRLSLNKKRTARVLKELSE